MVLWRVSLSQTHKGHFRTRRYTPHLLYCMWRLKRLASDLTKIGIALVLVAETLRQFADQGEILSTLTFQTRSSDDGNRPPPRVSENNCKLIAFRAIVNGGG